MLLVLVVPLHYGQVIAQSLPAPLVPPDDRPKAVPQNSRKELLLSAPYLSQPRRAYNKRDAAWGPPLVILMFPDKRGQGRGQRQTKGEASE